MLLLPAEPIRPLWIGIMGLCLMVGIVTGFAHPAVGFESAHPDQLWRWVTAHFSHHSVLHLLGNLAAWSLMLSLFRIQRRSLVIGLLLAMLLIDLWLVWQQIDRYMGFSGLLYVIPGVAFIDALRTGRWKTAVMIGLILVVYLQGVAVSDPRALWPPMTAAHWLGFLAGAISALACRSGNTQPEVLRPNQLVAEAG